VILTGFDILGALWDDSGVVPEVGWAVEQHPGSGES
jgi:hypothetical protein